MPRRMRYPWLTLKKGGSFFIPSIVGAGYTAHHKRLRQLGRIHYGIVCRRERENGIEGTRIYRDDAKNIPPDGKRRNGNARNFQRATK